MGRSFVFALLDMTVTLSLAILIVGVFRFAMRRVVGARVAYGLWLLVPASALTALLPWPSESLHILVGAMPRTASTTLSSAAVTVRDFGSSTGHAVIVLGIWISGSVLMMGVLFRRQRAFLHSLGETTMSPDGLHRSSSIVAPAVVGAWRARVVVPENFESSYSTDERRLMLAHERAHVIRGDAAVNAIAAGLLCFCWFNPLMYWAVGRLRFDQELACDAYVVGGSQGGRRCYADALLKSQLAADGNGPMPLGCHWQPSHPLKERIAMLKYSSPGRVRRWCGVASVVVLIFSGSYAVWSAQSEVSAAAAGGTPIALNIKWSVNDVDQLPLSTNDALIMAGREFDRTVSFAAGQINSIRCTASLHEPGKDSAFWQSIKASGESLQGLILLQCRLSHNGKTFATPAVLTRSDKTSTIEAASEDGSVRYRLEFNASTALARTSAAH